MSEAINTISEEDDYLWEPSTSERREMSRKYREEKDKKRKSTSVPSGGEPSVNKKKFHVKDIINIQPLTETQRRCFKSYYTYPEKNLFLYGSAGTGKSLIAMNFGIRDVLDPATPYEKLLIIRSTVPSRDMGFLPGDIAEKTAVYEEPYSSICDELFLKPHSYADLKANGYIEFTTSGFLRGKTFKDTVVFVDEIQNMNFSELSTIITRVGHNSKIIFSGDYRQNDLLGKRNDSSGFYPFIDIIQSEGMKEYFSVHQFGHNDIVRSGLVKQFIISSERFLANQFDGE